MATRRRTTMKPSRARIHDPLRRITRSGQTYLYAGELPNTKTARSGKRAYCRDHGRKVVFVTDKNDAKNAIAYVSARFYKSLVNVMNPGYGTGTL